MKKIIDKISFVLLTGVIFTLSVVLYGFCVEAVLLPTNFLLYENSPFVSMILAPLLVIPSVFISYYIVYFFKKKMNSENDFLHIIWFSKKLGKWKIAIAAVWLIALHVCTTSLTYVTNDRIVVLTPLNLKGRAYSYSKVEKIETGFGNQKFSFFEYEKEGNFYYKIYLDGQETVFHTSSVNSSIDRYQDTYLELEEFDQALGKLNIPKESSAAGADQCRLDKEYIHRFLRIIGED